MWPLRKAFPNIWVQAFIPWSKRKWVRERCWREQTVRSRKLRAPSTAIAQPSLQSRAEHLSKVTKEQTHNRTALPPPCSAASPLSPPQAEFSRSQYADMYTREKLSAQIKLPEETIKVNSASSSVMEVLVLDHHLWFCWQLCFSPRCGSPTEGPSGGGRPSRGATHTVRSRVPVYVCLRA